MVSKTVVSKLRPCGSGFARTSELLHNHVERIVVFLITHSGHQQLGNMIGLRYRKQGMYIMFGRFYMYKSLKNSLLNLLIRADRLQKTKESKNFLLIKMKYVSHFLKLILFGT